jgi:pSer/pThr/pTyr-binding forkhead associated (FHA) protein
MALSEDSAVSRKHARIVKEGNNYKVYDEGSSNGIYVNGVKVTEQELHSGDKLQIGTTVFRFEE